MPVSSPSPQVQDLSQPNLHASSPSNDTRPRKKLRGASTTGSRTSTNTTNTTTLHSPFLSSSPVILGWTPPLVPGSPSMSSLLPPSQRISPSPSVVSPTQQGSSSLSSSPQIHSTTPSPMHTKSTTTRYSSSTSSHSPCTSSSLAYTPSPYTPASWSSGSSSMQESPSPMQIHGDSSTTSSLSYPAVPLTLPAANPTALGLPQQQPYEHDVPKVAGKKRKRKRDAEDIDNKLKRSSTFSFSVPTLDDGSSTSPIVIRSRSNSPVLIIPTAAVPTPTLHASHAPPTPLELAAILESQCLPPHLLHIPIPQNSYPALNPTPPPTVASLIELANNLHAQKALATQQLQRDRRTLEALEAREQARERVQKMGFEYRYLVSEDLGRFVNPNERYPCDE
ncbi:hypothetical protein BDP27DRAFT_421321 [Rhodocollybia butyracea]|uniref:Uncharacterized protein n=1 Tax=Rhodocollybia butyracea TaxID=206335 RepID=A0A9P5PDZ5_9AGAR|nr:hypothetical protein BDP27DRAFT_421321 [Rhodocollybia butyracea]